MIAIGALSEPRIKIWKLILFYCKTSDLISESLDMDLDTIVENTVVLEAIK